MSITRINNNIAAVNANRNLSETGRNLQKSIERLSSGLRINRAGDDAAGMTIATRIRSQVRGLDRAVMNAQDGINLINVAEGAMEEMINRLDRIRVLAVQAANTGVNDVQSRQALQDEVFQSIDEITRIADTTQFGKNRLLNGDFSVDAQVKPGQDIGNNFGINIDQSPGANTLESGQHFLNIIQTQKGFASIVPGNNPNGDGKTMHSGVNNSTDIAVSLARFTQTTGGAATLFSAGADGTDLLASSGADSTAFNGVSILSGDVFTFSGVLSDGVTKFSGSLSLGAGAGFTFGDNGDASASATQLVGAINHAIDQAEQALFGVSTSASVPTAYRTTVTLSGDASNQGRLLLVADGEFINESDISINLNRAGTLVTRSEGVTRSGEIGINSALSGVGAIGNNVTAITGSTFTTGQFNISIEDVQGAQTRQIESSLVLRENTGSIFSRTSSLAHTGGRALNINGTFIDSVYTGGTSITAGDTISIRGTDADGTTFNATYTVSLDPATDTVLNDFQFASLSGLITELNYRTRDYTNNALDGTKTRFENALFTLAPSGKLTLIDDLGRNDSKLDFTFTFNDGVNNGTPTYTIQDKGVLKQEGFAETATVRVNGGEAIRAEAGSVVTAFGPEATKEGTVQGQVTFRLGSNLAIGQDILNVEGKEYVGSLNGGPKVTFQNGQQDVVFIDSSSLEEGVARFMTVDFDSILDITSSPTAQNDPGTTLIVSVVNSSVNFQIGAFAEQSFRTSIGDLSSQNLGFGRGSGETIESIDVSTLDGAERALRIVDEALDQINRTRSLLGAATNRLESTVASLSVSSENLLASESRIRDADIAQETTKFTQNQILVQAGTSVLAQANFIPQGFLSLLG